MIASAPLILTLKLDQHTFQILDNLRREHFPPERNVIPAHITLFHALPGEQLESIEQTLQRVCNATSQFDLTVAQPRSLGRGVALTVEGATLIQVRSQLATAWASWLSPQDAQRYQPHVTVQNKVSTAAAQTLLATLRAHWQPLAATGEGLVLWRYLGGPWAQVATFDFMRGEGRGTGKTR